jgi:hypothetical protein
MQKLPMKLVDYFTYLISVCSISGIEALKFIDHNGRYFSFLGQSAIGILTIIYLIKQIKKKK